MRRIERYAAENGIKKQAMCERLGISLPTLNKKLVGDSQFSAREIRALAVWWRVPSDYLLGITDEI